MKSAGFLLEHVVPEAIADLHRHLDGSLRPSTVVELAEPLGVAVPPDLTFRPGMGLSEALSRFEFTLSLLKQPAAVRRVASEICEDAVLEGVTTLEIRFAPQLHLGGGRIEEFVDAVAEGVKGRAGIILCGLYGEPPSVLESLVDVARSRKSVVGIDLAGGPAAVHEFSLSDYRGPFRRAAQLGIGRTVHAGEGRPPAEIRIAIEELGAQRIGHGTTLLDDPEVLELVVARQVTIEACPTSNVHTGVIAEVEQHPIGDWLDRGVRVCVCSDNTLLSETTAADELRRLAANRAFTPAHRAAAIRYGHEGAFRRGSQSE